MIWVDGKILAEGTEQDSIIFTRMQNDINFNWGCIYITENAELSVFKYCIIENANAIGIAISNVSKGVCFSNGRGIVNNCKFLNNAVSILSASYVKELVITDNNFIINAEVNPFYHNFSYGKRFIVTVLYGEDDPTQKTLICNNNFFGAGSYICLNATDISFYYNTVTNCWTSYGIGHFFDNKFINCEIGISGGHPEDSIFIKHNRFIGGDNGIDIDDAYVEISNNYFEGCDIYTDLTCSGKVYNNFNNGGRIRTPGYLEVSNNLSYNGSYIGVEVSWRNLSCNNNMTINNEYAIGSGGTVKYENCVFIMNNEIYNFPINGNPIFRNCILDFELPPECIDGGGNIWVDSLQAQTLFEDIQNGDFHLVEGSLAIDAGFDTLGYYYPFDLDYNHRIWDGNGNGQAIIDIGPYEYNSPSFGGITGETYNPENGEVVDYVLIKIDNQPGEFTFSDSVGNFEIKLSAGVYDIYAERVFYEDAIEYQVEVFDGEFTEIYIPMISANSVETPGVNPTDNNFNLRNHPNPFKEETEILFITSDYERVEDYQLSIYNVRGQLVKRYNGKKDDFWAKTKIVWDGKDRNGNEVSPGMYFYKLEYGEDAVVRKMVKVE